MKRFVIILFILLLGAASRVSIAQDDAGVSGEFYASLSPYGTWIELDNGLTVWRPLHMHSGWTPYRYGHWIWTDDGWYWDSDEPYGPIVYHYGRWYNDENYGWIWVPDNVWAPAWVEWRYDNDYIGWAPLAPYATFSVGVGISFSASFIAPISYWHFVGYRHMCDVNVYNYYVPDHDRYRIFSGSRTRTNYGYSNGRVINRGVDVDYVRQRGGGRIEERKIQTISDPRSAGGRGSGNVVRAYIPSHEQLARTDNRNVEIKRATRPTSLDVSKVKIGPRNNAARNENNGPLVNRETNRPDNRTNNREAPNTNPGNTRDNNRPNVINNESRQRPDNHPQLQVRPNNQPQERQNNRPQVQAQERQNNRPQLQPQPRVSSRPQVQPQARQNARPQPQVRQNTRPQPQPQARQSRPPQQPQARPNNNNDNRRR
jgi:hypothetical protein